MSSVEKTLSIIKPDAVERNLDKEIKQIFINNGFNISKEKKIQIEKSESEKFYKVHETKPFFSDFFTFLHQFKFSTDPPKFFVFPKKLLLLLKVRIFITKC